MTEDRFIDTEPDDAFALVLGDIDSSPLMRSSPLAEVGLTPVPNPSPQTVPPPAADAAEPIARPLSQEGDGAAAPRSEVVETAPGEDSQAGLPGASTDTASEPETEPAASTAPASVAVSERSGGGLFTVTRDGETARVFPKLAMLAHAAIPLQRLLRELEAEGVRRVTLDLSAAADMDADCLAVLIAFAGRAPAPCRLHLANANAVLSGLFQTVRLDQTYAVDLD
jgi:ABC-type transporter Mla MlaB component